MNQSKLGICCTTVHAKLSAGGGGSVKSVQVRTKGEGRSEIGNFTAYVKGTVMQIEKALIHYCLRVSKVF